MFCKKNVRSRRIFAFGDVIVCKKIELVGFEYFCSNQTERFL